VKIKEDENQAVVDSKDSQNNQGSSGVKIMQHAFRTLQKKEPDVQNKGSDCWYECGKRDGPCPHFCGKDGMCCQKGWPWGGCDGKIGPDNMHSCVEKIRDIDHGWIIADLNQNCHEACQKHNLQCTDDELRAHNEDVNTSDKVIKLIKSLGQQITMTECKIGFGIKAVPLFSTRTNNGYKQQFCYAASTYKKTFSCSSVPAPAKENRQRLCWCHEYKDIREETTAIDYNLTFEPVIFTPRPPKEDDGSNFDGDLFPPQRKGILPNKPEKHAFGRSAAIAPENPEPKKSAVVTVNSPDGVSEDIKIPEVKNLDQMTAVLRGLGLDVEMVGKLTHLNGALGGLSGLQSQNINLNQGKTK